MKTKKKKYGGNKETNFIHFGCWNQGLCNMIKNNNPLSNVMKTLNEFVNTINVDFISVAGDNYYPNKIKLNKEKIKRIYSEELKSGFDCLPENKEIYMLLGNHDLETNLDSDQNIYIENTDELESNCYILNKELEYSDTHKPPINFVFNHYKFVNNTLILMIDSSIYIKKADKFLKCYQYLLSNNLHTIDEIMKIQELFILNTINKYKNKFKNLMFIAHHPIIGYQYKDKKSKLIKPFYNMAKMLTKVYSILGDTVNYYHLCADLHLRQEGIININDMIINQYVAGTGGTKLDKSSKSFPKYTNLEIDDMNIDFELNISEEVYGFLHCYIKNGLIQFAFINSIYGGKKKIKKTKKIKNKKHK